MGWGDEVGSEICGAFAIRAGLCYAGGRGGRGTIYFHRRKLQKLVSTPVGIGNRNSKTIFTDQHQINTSMSTDQKSCQIDNVFFFSISQISCKILPFVKEKSWKNNKT